MSLVWVGGASILHISLFLFINSLIIYLFIENSRFITTHLTPFRDHTSHSPPLLFESTLTVLLDSPPGRISVLLAKDLLKKSSLKQKPNEAKKRSTRTNSKTQTTNTVSLPGPSTRLTTKKRIGYTNLWTMPWTSGEKLEGRQGRERRWKKFERNDPRFSNSLRI